MQTIKVMVAITVEGETSGINGNMEGIDNCLRSVNKWPEGLTILQAAFCGQSNLTSVPDELPSGVTSLS